MRPQDPVVVRMSICTRHTICIRPLQLHLATERYAPCTYRAINLELVCPLITFFGRF